MSLVVEARGATQTFGHSDARASEPIEEGTPVMTQQLDERVDQDTVTAADPEPIVGVVGLGYVGLPTAIGFAATSRGVVGVDANPARLDRIRALDVDLLPEDLVGLRTALDAGSVTVTDDASLLAAVDAIIICVPTPVDDHLTPDLGPLAAACRDVVAIVRPGQLVVLTSTTYVGTTDDLVVRPLERRGFRVGTDVFVAFSPERIDPGNAAFAHRHVPRVVGGATPECTRRAAALIARSTGYVHPVSSTRAAELTKLYENTFRAVNIALVNEIADASRQLDVTVTEVIDAAATKPYGFMPFTPGPGVGGHCIPCDPHYLLWQLRSRRVSMPLVESAMNCIAGRPSRVVARIREELGDRRIALRGARIVVIGVAYKPGVADFRESPALEIIDRLTELGADVSYLDPMVPEVTIGGRTARSLTAPPPVAPDLVVLHTRHPGQQLGWLAGVPAVLDATYRAFDIDNRVSI